MRMIAGKVLMDRNAPARSARHGEARLRRKQGADRALAPSRRLAYAITPRFAATSTPAQLEAAVGAVARDARRVPAFARRRERGRSRMDRVALSGARAAISTSTRISACSADARCTRMASISTKTISSAFTIRRRRSRIVRRRTISSAAGSFPLHRARDPRRPAHVALATDLGGGTSFSMLRTMQAASEVAHLGGHPLSPSCAWWLATRGAAEALDLGRHIGAIETGARGRSRRHRLAVDRR